MDEDLLRQLEKRAAENGRTLQVLANELLLLWQSLIRPLRRDRFELHL